MADSIFGLVLALNRASSVQNAVGSRIARKKCAETFHRRFRPLGTDNGPEAGEFENKNAFAIARIDKFYDARPNQPLQTGRRRHPGFARHDAWQAAPATDCWRWL